MESLDLGRWELRHFSGRGGALFPREGERLDQWPTGIHIRTVSWCFDFMGCHCDGVWLCVLHLGTLSSRWSSLFYRVVNENIYFDIVAVYILTSILVNCIGCLYLHLSTTRGARNANATIAAQPDHVSITWIKWSNSVYSHTVPRRRRHGAVW